MENKVKKTVKIKENDLVSLIENLITESIESKTKKAAPSKKESKGKTIKIKESALVDIIDKIVTETKKIKEMDETPEIGGTNLQMWMKNKAKEMPTNMNKAQFDKITNLVNQTLAADKQQVKKATTTTKKIFEPK